MPDSTPWNPDEPDDIPDITSGVPWEHELDRGRKITEVTEIEETTVATEYKRRMDGDTAEVIDAEPVEVMDGEATKVMDEDSTGVKDEGTTEVRDEAPMEIKDEETTEVMDKETPEVWTRRFWEL